MAASSVVPVAATVPVYFRLAQTGAIQGSLPYCCSPRLVSLCRLSTGIPARTHFIRYLDPLRRATNEYAPSPPTPLGISTAVFYVVPLSRSSIYQRTRRFPTRCHKTWTNSFRARSPPSVPCHHAVPPPPTRPCPAGGRGGRRVIRPAGCHGFAGIVSLSLPVRFL